MKTVDGFQEKELRLRARRDRASFKLQSENPPETVETGRMAQSRMASDNRRGRRNLISGQPSLKLAKKHICGRKYLLQTSLSESRSNLLAPGASETERCRSYSTENDMADLPGFSGTIDHYTSVANRLSSASLRYRYYYGQHFSLPDDIQAHLSDQKKGKVSRPQCFVLLQSGVQKCMLSIFGSSC